MHVFISWYRSACSASFARKMNDAFAIVNGGCEELRAQRARKDVNEKEKRGRGGADAKDGGSGVVSAVRASRNRVGQPTYSSCSIAYVNSSQLESTRFFFSSLSISIAILTVQLVD